MFLALLALGPLPLGGKDDECITHVVKHIHGFFFKGLSVTRAPQWFGMLLPASVCAVVQQRVVACSALSGGFCQGRQEKTRI